MLDAHRELIEGKDPNMDRKAVSELLEKQRRKLTQAIGELQAIREKVDDEQKDALDRTLKRLQAALDEDENFRAIVD